MTNNDTITIRGAREHNLKNVDLKLPKNHLIVFTGLSGSGKSSLAFDTLYAEGQRRYVESLNTYARQFLGIMDKPDVDIIEGLSPAIAIDQKSTPKNPRSTVGTVTEIYDYLRILYARIGHPHCPQCGREVNQQSPQQIIAQARQLIGQKIKQDQVAKFFILAPLVRSKKGRFEGLFANLIKKGFSQVRVDSKFFNLQDDFSLLKNNRHNIDVVVDRLSFRQDDLADESGQAQRLTEGINNALTLSEGKVVLLEINDASFDIPEKPQETKDHLFSELFACPECNISIPEIQARSFSFNTPSGACPKCNGIGKLLRFDPQLVLNENLSVSEGGIMPLVKIFYRDTWYARTLRQVAEKRNWDLRQSLDQWNKKDREKLLWGTGEKEYHIQGTNRHNEPTTITETFPGIIAELNRRYQETDSDHIRSGLEKFMIEKTCPQCQGARLKKEALRVTINDSNISKLTSYNIKKIYRWIKQVEENINLSSREQQIARPVIKEIKTRLRFLLSVGLDYLSLDRTTGTLAGGEAQRIRLASQIGTGLTGVLYVLDEPTIGLHPRDNSKLINTLKNLKDLGNTVVVVEHDRQIMEESDWLVDFGPGAGQDGGQIVAAGQPQEIKQTPASLTGQYLTNEKKISLTKTQPPQTEEQTFTLHGCRQFNLKNIDVDFPLNRLIGVTGVSGSGKSTLINETLYPAIRRQLDFKTKKSPGKYDKISGAETIKHAYFIDQSPIGRTPRSNPATYTSLFTTIRQLFAQTPEAKIRGYDKGQFSFNTKGGRCEACSGYGENKIEMQFLSDVYVECEVCQGRRYNEETLEVKYKGKNIADVLEMTVGEAKDFFKNIPGAYEKLSVLSQVGLDYIELGQPAPTLSGGEAQRIKIAHELVKQSPQHTLYILDEPSTGLHFADLKKLITVLKQLVSEGNTVIVIEHNLDLIKNCDWLIDLGPEGGAKGGRVVAKGSPRQVARQDSHTGHYLKKMLGQ